MQICWRVIFSASPDPLPPRGGENVSDSKFDSFDDSALVGLSTQSLKRLSINAGSLVSPYLSSLTDLHKEKKIDTLLFVYIC